MPTNTYWSYNNSGFVMLGQAFRRLSGTELPEFARTRLFDRMGMTNSSIVYDLPHIKTHLARPYVGGEVYPDEYCNLFFAGSIYSTAVGHGVLFATNGCTLQIFRDFLANPFQAPDTTCITNLSLTWSAPWPGATPTLAMGQTITNIFAAPNSGAWVRFSAVSGLIYSVRQPQSGALLRLADGNANVLATTTGTQMDWLSLVDGSIYLWTVSADAGAFELGLEYPLLLRAIYCSSEKYAFTWQSETNATYDVWMTTNLFTGSAQVKIGTNVAATGWFTSFTNAMPPSARSEFFHLRKTP